MTVAAVDVDAGLARLRALAAALGEAESRQRVVLAERDATWQQLSAAGVSQAAMAEASATTVHNVKWALRKARSKVPPAGG